MADEIELSFRFQVDKDDIQIDEARSNVIDMSGTHPFEIKQDIGFATHEALAIPSDVASLGVTMFENCDATNYVEIGVVVSATFYPSMRLLAGEAFPMRLSPAVTYYAKANTAAVKLRVRGVEN